MTPPWIDERSGLLKSAVQKHIRRGETDQACAAAARLLALPNGRSALERRLPIIAVEDVGWYWVAAASAPPDASADANLLAIVASLSALPKNKEGYWLAATVWEGRLRAPNLTADGLRRALADGDHRTALALILAARDQKQWRSHDRLVRVLIERLGEGPHVARLIGEAALAREAKGGGVAELLAAAVIVAIDRPDSSVPHLPHVRVPSPSAFRPSWYIADGHTQVGQRVLHRLAVKWRIRYETLAELMFSFESLRLGPTEIPNRWRAQGLALDAKQFGWQTYDQGAELWDGLRAEVRDELESELRELRL